jgi:DNA-binding response OmpR family regulator
VGGKRRLLIIESNPGALIVARNILAREGYEVLTAGEIGDGIARARKNDPEVVLLDGALAEPALLRDLSEISSKTLPVVMLVPKGLGPALLETLSADAYEPELVIVEVVEKPFMRDQLLRGIEKGLALRDQPPTFDTVEPDTVDADPCEVVSAVDLTGDDSTRPITPFALEIEKARIHAIASRIVANIPDGATVSEDVLVHACEVALERTPPARPDSNRGDLLMSGRLGRITVDQVIQFAEAVPGTVSCVLEHDRQSIQIFLREHTVIFARQKNMIDAFGLGRFLADGGSIDRSRIDALISSRSPGLLGETLLDEDLIDRETLERALRRQTEELVYDALRWSTGMFSISGDPGVPEEAELAGIALGITPLLMEGLRRLDEWHRLVRELGGPGVVPIRRPTTDEIPLLERLTTTQRTLLYAVDGKRTVEDIVISAKRPVFDVWKALADLRASDLLTVDEE